MNTLMIREAIGKPVGKVKMNPVKLGQIRNKVENMYLYTEAAHRDESEKDACLKSLSAQIEACLKIIDEAIDGK